MTTEDKAQSLVNEVRSEYPLVADFHATSIALCRAIERHEAFRQEVSDAAEEATDIIDHWSGDRDGAKCLQDFIIPKPKPDPLVAALNESGVILAGPVAKDLRAALEARGLEIREKDDD